MMIVGAMFSSIIAALSLPFAIAVVASAFQSMIEYDKSVADGTHKVEEFMHAMRWFGVEYSCLGVILFLGGYFGTAFMNIAAINQVCINSTLTSMILFLYVDNLCPY